MSGILLLGAAAAVGTVDAQPAERYEVCLRGEALAPAEPLDASEDKWGEGFVSALVACSRLRAEWRQFYLQDARLRGYSENASARYADLRLSQTELRGFVSWKQAVITSALNSLHPVPYDPMIIPEDTEQ